MLSTQTETFFVIDVTDEFRKWLKSLRNPIARTAIVRRIERATVGNFGDHKSVGNGIYEMRISTGAGYRIYYAQRGEIIYILLNGGDKSIQQKDIAEAKLLWESIKQKDKQNLEGVHNEQ
ncbi:hypothetical protein A1D22_00185 [Pasteurellaceae bacterium LFhippo2]|nr:hypothetical protein [Pasteurellaceae bacterium LFhippo2]